MSTFKQFVTELASEDVALSPSELQEMTERFGDKVLQMGRVEQDGRMLVPVDCVVEAARSIGSRALIAAAESLNNEQMASLLRSGEALVKRVIEAREKKLREMIRSFQNEPSANKSDQQWRQIEKEVCGVDYHD